jgi:hypothetical protein
MIKAADECRIGMKVRHVSPSSKSGGLGEGEIVGIGRDGVLVVFANGARGLYDGNWFQYYADVWLEIVD